LNGLSISDGLRTNIKTDFWTTLPQQTILFFGVQSRQQAANNRQPATRIAEGGLLPEEIKLDLRRRYQHRISVKSGHHKVGVAGSLLYIVAFFIIPAFG
jgi:hypothetical protein